MDEKFSYAYCVSRKLFIKTDYNLIDLNGTNPDLKKQIKSADVISDSMIP